jgi:3-oxoacyl-[acyl-carrier protein] reductase
MVARKSLTQIATTVVFEQTPGVDLGLRDKAVIVTGGSRGIGRATALMLADEGASVAVVARGEEDLREVVASIEARGGKACAITADLAAEAEVARAFKLAEQTIGPCDVLINNAGGSLGSGTFDTVDAAKWAAVMDLNLTSAVNMSRLAVDSMKARGGAIVHIGSICGREYCTSAPYLAAKAALGALTKEMAVDLAKFGIRVACVAPGSIMFPGGSWDRRKKEKPDMIERMVRDDLPWGRFGTPEEVAQVAVFLASPRASWVTGSTVVVDGAQGRAF